MKKLYRRVIRTIRRHGVIGAARLVLARLSTATELGWYRLDLVGERRRRELGDDLVLRRGTAEDAVRVAELPPMPHVAALTADDVVERLDRGAELWLVAHRDRVAFACWTFHGEARVHGVRRGVLMPPDTVLLEDSILSPDFSGRSIPASAWAGVADRLEARGLATMMTKVDATNPAALWAFKRAGFREVARMSVEHRWRRNRVRIHFTDDDQSNRWLGAFDH